jgi:hypothetical protein
MSYIGTKGPRRTEKPSFNDLDTIETMGINLLYPNKTNSDWSNKYGKKKNIWVTAEATLNSETENVIKGIQNSSRKYCQLNEEWTNLKRELEEVKAKFEKTTPDIVLETKRAKIKARNVQRDIKCQTLSTNTSIANLIQSHTDVENSRRINLHYKRHINTTHTKIMSSSLYSTRINRSVVSARGHVSNLLDCYKTGIQESVNLRKGVIRELALNNRRSSMLRAELPGLSHYLTNFENYEVEGRDLLKHRIIRDKMKNVAGATEIETYILRMEEIDDAFSRIKHAEGITNIEEIYCSLERIDAKKQIMYGELYALGNVKGNFKSQNAWLRQHNENCRLTLERLSYENVNNEKHKVLKDDLLQKEHDGYGPEIKELDREY